MRPFTPYFRCVAKPRLSIFTTCCLIEGCENHPPRISQHPPSFPSANRPREKALYRGRRVLVRQPSCCSLLFNRIVKEQFVRRGLRLSKRLMGRHNATNSSPLESAANPPTSSIYTLVHIWWSIVQIHNLQGSRLRTPTRGCTPGGSGRCIS